MDLTFVHATLATIFAVQIYQLRMLFTIRERIVRLETLQSGVIRTIHTPEPHA